MIRRISSTLLYPATALVNRLSFPNKFVLLGLISLFAIGVTLYSLYSNLHHVVISSRKEIEGLALMESIAKTVQIVQKHRGLSSGVLGGIDNFSLERAAKERDAEAAFSILEASLPASSRQLESLKDITTGWKRIQANGLQWTQIDNFSAHTRLIEKMLLYGTDIADGYGLTADPDLDTFYLSHTAGNELLEALERLGQIRALGAGILGKKQISEQQKAHLNTTIELLNYLLQPLKNSIEKAARYNPGLENALFATYANFEKASQQVINEVRLDILSGNFITSPSDYFGITTAAIDDGYTQLYQSMLPTSRRLIQERIQRAEAVMQTVIGIAFLLTLLVAYFMVAIYYATLGSIQKLSRSVIGFVRGDMRDRVKLETHDELSLIGDSFNTMADEITELIAERQAAAQYSRSLLEASLDPLVTISAEGKITDVNAATEKATGMDRTKLIGSDFTSYFTDPEKAREGYQQVFAQGFVTDYPLAIHHVSGKIIEVLYNASLYRDKNGNVRGVFAAARDITERKLMEDQVRQLAFYDTLTKLPNRRLLNERLSQALAASKRTESYGALMFLDLDNFKPLNDKHGHVVGDLLLIEVADRLKSCVREIDTVARFGGDEFVVMINELDADKAKLTAHARIVAEKIRAALAEPYLLTIRQDGKIDATIEHHCTASIGVVVFINHEGSQDDILKWADAAMYKAKESGRNSIRFFDAKV